VIEQRKMRLSNGETPAEYEVLLHDDCATFAMRCFHDLNPQTCLAMNWHLRVIRRLNIIFKSLV
jgi:hypothetical protein